MDILQSYYFARILDQHLMKHEKYDSDIIANCIRMTEREFLDVDFEDLKNKLEQSGWSLEYIYLDPKRNRYSVDKVESEEE